VNELSRKWWKRQQSSRRQQENYGHDNEDFEQDSLWVLRLKNSSGRYQACYSFSSFMMKSHQLRSDIQFDRILLLEDDRDFSSVLKEFLESVPYDVVAVENGVEGLREIMARDFDAVICDMMMPKLNGEMFYRAIERIKPSLCQRFVFITGFRGNPNIDNFMKQIKGTMLPKPFHMDMLRESVEFALQRK
jgi:CheY-like chemotaxis protein